VLGVRALYHNQMIDQSLRPALMLVGPQFAPALRRAARQLRCATIKSVRYRTLESSVGLGLFFERLAGQ